MILAIAAVVIGFASSHNNNMIRVRSPRYYSESLVPSLLFDSESFVSRMIKEQRAITRSMLDLLVVADHHHRQFFDLVGDHQHQQLEDKETRFSSLRTHDFFPDEVVAVDDDHSETFQLTVEVPGLEAEDDIDVTFNTDDGQLAVRGQKEDVSKSSRVVSTFSKTFSLNPRIYDADKITASLKDGVLLTVTAPTKSNDSNNEKLQLPLKEKTAAPSRRMIPVTAKAANFAANVDADALPSGVDATNSNNGDTDDSRKMNHHHHKVEKKEDVGEEEENGEVVRGNDELR